MPPALRRRSGEDPTYHPIHDIGRAQLTDAIPTIEGYLTHLNAQYRYVALEALTNHFHVQRHGPPLSGHCAMIPTTMCEWEQPELSAT